MLKIFILFGLWTDWLNSQITKPMYWTLWVGWGTPPPKRQLNEDQNTCQRIENTLFYCLEKLSTFCTLFLLKIEMRSGLSNLK